MAIGVHASAAVSSGGDPTTAGVTTQATGSTIDVVVTADAGSFTSLSDNKGNTYTLIGSEVLYNATNSFARHYRCENAAGGTGHTWSLVTTSAGATIYAVELLDVLTSSVLDQEGGQEDTSSPFTSTSETLTQADEILVSALLGDSGSNPATNAESTGFTIQEDVTNGASFYTGCLATKIVASAGPHSSSFTESGAAGAAVMIATFKLSAAVVLEQEGFRFRNDDGTEATATWKAAQDTDVTSSDTLVRLRVILNVTGNPASSDIGLKYAKNGGQLRTIHTP